MRRWASIRATGKQTLPNVVGHANALGASAELAVSLTSVFELAEALLEHPLATERASGGRLTSDERAVLLLLAAAPAAGPIVTTRVVPHGLPGVLVWAARAARVALRRCGVDLPIESDVAVLRPARSTKARGLDPFWIVGNP